MLLFFYIINLVVGVLGTVFFFRSRHGKYEMLRRNMLSIFFSMSWRSLICVIVELVGINLHYSNLIIIIAQTPFMISMLAFVYYIYKSGHRHY